MPIEHFERDLTDAERTELGARVERLDRMTRFSLLKAGAASLIVCGILATLTLLASDAPRPLIVGFWLGMTLLFAVWIGTQGRAGFRRQRTALAGAIRHNRARVVRIQSSRVVEFEEIEDEGACYAFDVGDRRIVFLQGQEFYPDAEFPNRDFSLVAVLGPGNSVVDEIFVKTGAVLQPERRIGRDVKNRLTIPDHLEVMEGDLKTIEAALTSAR
jgi:hypothetical protein